MDSTLIGRKDQTGITIRSDESNESPIALGLMGDLTAELNDIIRSADFDSRLECLLERFSDLNETFASGRTILHHLALTKPRLKGGNVAKCVSVLAERGVNLDAKDIVGCTALHYAARTDNQPCSDALIKAGADLCIKNDAGESALKNVLRHLPNSLQAIEERLDRGITLRCDDSGNEDDKPVLVYVLNFNVLLSKSHDDFFDANVLSEILEDAKDNQGIYNKMTQMEKVFLHPLTECFLNYRWKLVSLAYWTHLISHLIFSLTYSAYVFEVYSLVCNPFNEINPTWNGTHWINDSVPWNQEIRCNISNRHGKSAIGAWVKKMLNDRLQAQWVQALWLLLVGFIIIYTVKEIVIFAYMGKRYLTGTYAWENRLNLLILITFPFIIVHQFPTDTMTIKYYKYHVAAVSVFITWILNMLHIAHSPDYGHYIHMMVKISINFFKFFIAISSLLIAFATSFTILFPREASMNYIWTSPLKAISMMAGEVGYNDLMYRTNWIVKKTDNGSHEYLDAGLIPQMFPDTSFVIINIFIVIFPVIVMNLFFGIAVNDVQSIMDKGLVQQKIKMVKIIKIYEKILALTHCLVPCCLRKFVKRRQVWFDREVIENICEVDLDSQGSKKMISRGLSQRLMVAVERVQNKERQEPTLDDIMKKMERLEQKLDEIKD